LHHQELIDEVSNESSSDDTHSNDGPPDTQNSQQVMRPTSSSTASSDACSIISTLGQKHPTARTTNNQSRSNGPIQQLSDQTSDRSQSRQQKQKSQQNSALWANNSLQQQVGWHAVSSMTTLSPPSTPPKYGKDPPQRPEKGGKDPPTPPTQSGEEPIPRSQQWSRNSLPNHIGSNPHAQNPPNQDWAQPFGGYPGGPPHGHSNGSNMQPSLPKGPPHHISPPYHHQIQHCTTSLAGTWHPRGHPGAGDFQMNLPPTRTQISLRVFIIHGRPPETLQFSASNNKSEPYKMDDPATQKDDDPATQQSPAKNNTSTLKNN